MQFLSHNVRRVVVKIGTNTLTANGGGIDISRIETLTRQIAHLRKQGIEVVVVSSGAIGLGMGQLGLKKRPTDLTGLQACAAIGQPLLVSTWLNALKSHQITGAEVLLTREDVRGRQRHVAIRDTLERLLKLGVVPIINENDTVSAAEIKFGDNDVLSALVSSLIQADLLVILSTIPGLIDFKGTGAVVPLIPEITPEIRAMAGGTDSPTAVGGMISKVDAAEIAIQSGCGVFIGDGAHPSLLIDLAAGEAEGTFFVPRKLPMAARKRWIAFFQRPAGSIRIDAGAEEAIRKDGSSLLAKGVVLVEGEFEEGAVVAIESSSGRLLARGLAGFASRDMVTVAGKGSDEIRKAFPQRRRCEVVHRNSLVLVG
ncbi:MAG: glutamate 5-kinase [Opitutales bacterium]|nr:glutamate 5-kinase [Opitutales bacterium]